MKRTATEVLRDRLGAMDPADAIRIARDAHPDADPAELASMLVTYGVTVSPVQVALVLHGRPPEITVDRDDTDDAPRDAPVMRPMMRVMRRRSTARPPSPRRRRSFKPPPSSAATSRPPTSSTA
ncbi:hypothetical protein [Streptomyces microflavus]|uniref:hypothetical protein n=1 Tax=Streptomyces microflavus TaxID=1919 RepID=UPI003B219DC5